MNIEMRLPSPYSFIQNIKIHVFSREYTVFAADNNVRKGFFSASNMTHCNKNLNGLGALFFTVKMP